MCAIQGCWKNDNKNGDRIRDYQKGGQNRLEKGEEKIDLRSRSHPPHQPSKMERGIKAEKSKIVQAASKEEQQHTTKGGSGSRRSIKKKLRVGER